MLDNQKLNQILEILNNHKPKIDLIDRIAGTLTTHTNKFDAIFKTLDEHSKILNEHTTMLKKQGNILLAHSEILNSHTSLLLKHSEQLEKIEGRQDEVNNKLDLHTQKLIEHDKRFNEQAKRSDKHDELFSTIIHELFTMNQRIESMDEKTKYIPKIYDMLDKMTSNVQKHENERAFLNHRANNHEERLVVVEGKLGVTAVSRDLF